MDTMNAVIDKTSKKVKRYCWGCDFENDGSFNPSTEEIVTKDFFFVPDIDQQDWYWNGTTFQTDPV